MVGIKLETHNQNPSCTTCVIAIIRKVIDKPDSTILSIFTLTVKEFSDVPKELQDKTSPICDT